MKSHKGTYIDKLSILIEIQKKIKTIQPVFDNYYPVTVVSNNNFEIFNVLSDKDEYEYIKSEPCPFPIPIGVRAAFPLDCYDNKMSAIVSSDVFDTQEGYVAILHEFVHCAQSMECEAELKDQLDITQEYRKKNDYMWELNHPFPYTNQSYIDFYSKYMDSFIECDYNKIMNLRQKFKSIIGIRDREYLLWQEWKEGLARFLENKIRNYLGIEENHYGSEMPFSRVSFYESGSRLISLIEKVNPNCINDMRGLFYEMKKYIF